MNLDKQTVLRACVALGPPIALAACLTFSQPAGAAHAAGPSQIQAEKPTMQGGYEVRSVWSIGGPDAPDAAQFYEKVGGVTFDSDSAGRLYVLDNGNSRVQVFSPDGTFLRSFGSEGKGPGEFNLPRQIAVNAKGEVAVQDVGNQRVSIFGPDGTLLRDQLISGAVNDIELTDDGYLVCSISNRYELVAYGPDGKIVFDYGYSAPQAVEREVNIETPFQTVGTRLIATKDREFVQAGRAEYEVTVFESADPKLRWSRPFERQALEMPAPREGDGEGTQVVMIMSRDDGGGAGGTADTETWSSDQGDGQEMHFDLSDLQDMIPKHVPDIRGLLVWPDERVWVITAENDGDRMVVDEWSLGGQYLRRFDMERYAWLTIGEDGALYGLTHDDDDYPFVHRLEVVPES
ncbi:MAG: NHL repeat-containing protein [Candidatus Eisenbacteria bacterium]|nr:NHL repeat-containing protein [Candidatus Eisenbacteria bacterium]